MSIVVNRTKEIFLRFLYISTNSKNGVKKVAKMILLFENLTYKIELDRERNVR